MVWIWRLSISTVWRLMERMDAPSCSKIFKIAVTSEIWGMFSMRQTPSTRMAAGIMATAAFFAPLISTSPNRGLPPCTMYFVNVLTSFQVFFCGEKALRRD